MNRKNPVHAYGHNIVFVNAIYTGGGNTTDLSVPADADVDKSFNAALTGARTGEGVYDCVIAEGAGGPRCVQVIPHCEGAGHRAEVTTAYDPTTRTVVITTRDSSGTADDLPTTDQLKLLLVFQDSKA